MYLKIKYDRENRGEKCGPTKHAENSHNSHEMDGLFQSKQKWGYTGIT